MFIVNHRSIFFTLTGLVIAGAIFSLVVFGLHPGIDFTGGSLTQVSYLPAQAGEGGRPSAPALEASLNEAGFSGYSLREAGESAYILRADTMSEAARAALPQTLSVGGQYPAIIEQQTEVGPTIGTELRNKSLVALAVVLVAILFFIAFAFRKVSKPVSSWVYGGIALVALLHDVIVPAGFFAALQHYAGAQLDTLFVTAILTVLGFSVHDTIVVFDRTRENLRRNQERGRKEDFSETAGRALQATFVRSVNTSLTVAFTLGVLYAVGPAATRDFALTLLVGIIAGTYSSIFLATPLLVAYEKWRGQTGK